MRIPAAAILILALVPAGACRAQDGPERSTTAIWAETLRYGTDPEILDALGRIRDARELSLAPDLARLAGESRNDDVRSSILSYLGETKDKGAEAEAAAILRAREDQSPGLLRSAMAYLAAIGSPEGIDDLEALTESGDDAVAVAAVVALGKIRGRGTAEYLLEALDREETSPNFRNQVILALGELEAGAAVGRLVEIAADRDEERVARMYACASLGRIGDQRAVPVLTAVLSENDAMLRAYAAAALGRLRAPGVAEALTQVLRDASWQVRLEAARAVADGAAGTQAGEELLGMLSYRARRDDVAQVRREAIRALGTLGGASSFELLRQLLEDVKQPLDIRMACLAELVRGDLEASLGSIAAVIDQEWSARTQKALEATAQELSKAESPVLAGIYGRLLESPNVAVKIWGIRGVARNAMGQFAEQLRAATTDPLAAVRREALAAMEKLGIPSAAADSSSGAR